MNTIRVVEWLGENGLEVILSIFGSFDVRLRDKFNIAFKKIPEETDRIVVNFQKTTYIDTAAVGMLLGLRAFANTHQMELVIDHCHATIRPLLERACVDHLFNIKEA